MTLQEAINYFQNLVERSTKKRDIKRYQNFVDMLIKLKNRELSKDQLESIEVQLENFNLKTDQPKDKKQYNKLIKEFKKFLKDEMSLTTVGYYTNTAVSYGILFGVVAGVIFGERFEKSMGISLGISIGMMIGALIGKKMDAKAMAEGKVI